MQVFMLYSYYYDGCDEWDNLIDIYDSEEKALTAQIEEDEKDKYKKWPDSHRTAIEQREVK